MFFCMQKILQIFSCNSFLSIWLQNMRIIKFEKKTPNTYAFTNGAFSSYAVSDHFWNNFWTSEFIVNCKSRYEWHSTSLTNLHGPKGFAWITIPYEILKSKQEMFIKVKC